MVQTSGEPPVKAPHGESGPGMMGAVTPTSAAEPAVVRRTTSVRTRRAGLVALALAPVLLAAGCGGSKADSGASASPSASPSVALPTGDVKVPSGTKLTAPGTDLGFGDTATVAYEANKMKASVLALTVDSVQTGTIRDFSAYQLDARTKQSTPYYVRATVKNVGTGDLGLAGVPLLAVDARNTLIQASSFSNSFKRCPSTGLPAKFAGGATSTVCLVYLVPSAGTLTAMSYRPLQAFEPITWKGTVKPVALKKKAGKK